MPPPPEFVRCEAATSVRCPVAAGPSTLEVAGACVEAADDGCALDADVLSAALELAVADVDPLGEFDCAAALFEALEDAEALCFGEAADAVELGCVPAGRPEVDDDFEPDVGRAAFDDGRGAVLVGLLVGLLVELLVDVLDGRGAVVLGRGVCVGVAVGFGAEGTTEGAPPDPNRKPIQVPAGAENVATPVLE
ncbi:hypothetical protein [Yimella sp. NH-Cas1]|uniref:hypothetical protein n=1 Tax=Yimella sp. NH-Cas1 TaxID=2917726 RepID=UPI001EFC0C34|nr:hypothetical protein [Yimella sp. NH-Cas1]MCG8655746.1 hypothetical protein [Yimella sp. NH-Cas1]